VADPQEHQRRDLIMATLASRTAVNGGFVMRHELEPLVLPDGTVQRLVDGGGGGIWNPTDFSATLSIITSPDGPYADRDVAGGLLHYKYQRGSEQGKNAKLRAAIRQAVPVILLKKIRANTFFPLFPVYVVGDNPIAREFVIALDESLRSVGDATEMTPLERRYADRLIRQRVHQPEFRARIMLAYESRCTICSLRHAELLDAAHIIADGDDGGEPIVTNGLSLCKIHHAAYDRDLLGISADYAIHINARLLNEVDGPMLTYGLQKMHGQILTLPNRLSDRPSPDRLEERFSGFLALNAS
jgi:putative restriction endonuclease